MNKIFLLLMIFVLSFNIVYAIPSGTDYTLKTIDKCIGSYLVIVNSDNVANDYNVLNCIKKDDASWKCDCNEKGKTEIIIGTQPTTKNVYDFTISYYVGKERDEINERIARIYNIEFKPTIEERRQTEYIPPTELDMISTFLIGLFGLTLIGIIVMIFMLFLEYKKPENSIDSDDKKDKKSKNKNKKMGLSDDELDNMLDNV